MTVATLLSPTATVQLPEILWTLFGLIGVYLGSANFTDARKYVAAIDKLNGRNLAGYKVMRTIAFGHVRSESLRTLVYSVMVIIGIGAMLIAPANSARPVSALSAIITIGFFLIMAILVADSYLDKRQREALGRAADDRARAEPRA